MLPLALRNRACTPPSGLAADIAHPQLGVNSGFVGVYAVLARLALTSLCTEVC